ncbi:MAG: Hsp20/alpha crystallin family protein [Actinomycetota bacterium]|nr:Hsp20/alpha crystallin family protein [Actinomycetota bacterium]
MVRVELAGLRPEDVEVSANDGMLTISGERKFDADIAEDAWVRRERPTGRFERSFGLPQSTDPAGISAEFNHGLLELRIPHPPERRPHRVEVGSASNDANTVQIEEQHSG